MGEYKLRYLIALFDNERGQYVLPPSEPSDTYTEAVEKIVRSVERSVPPPLIIAGDKVVSSPPRFEHRVLIEPGSLDEQTLANVVHRDPFLSAIFHAGAHAEWNV